MRMLRKDGWGSALRVNGREEILAPSNHSLFRLRATRSPLAISARKQLKTNYWPPKTTILFTHTPVGSVVTACGTARSQTGDARYLTAHGFIFFHGCAAARLANLLSGVSWRDIPTRSSRLTTRIINGQTYIQDGCPLRAWSGGRSRSSSSRASRKTTQRRAGHSGLSRTISWWFIQRS